MILFLNYRLARSISERDLLALEALMLMRTVSLFMETLNLRS